jgi:hypothetical protein
VPICGRLKQDVIDPGPGPILQILGYPYTLGDLVRCCEANAMSERHACKLVQQPLGTQRYQPALRNDEDALARAIVELAGQYGRYGYRRNTALLQRAGWRVGKNRKERT